MTLKPTAEQIKFLREEKQISLFEAKEIQQKSLLLEAINSATSIDEIKQILKYLVEHVKIT